MARMVVTLDVSKLSSLLNSSSNCRVAGKAYGAGRARLDVRGERVEAQRLVERERALPSRKGGHAKRVEVWVGRREGGGC